MRPWRLCFRSLGESGQKGEEAAEVSFGGLETRHGKKLVYTPVPEV